MMNYRGIHGMKVCDRWVIPGIQKYIGPVDGFRSLSAAKAAIDGAIISGALRPSYSRNPGR